MPMTAKAWNRSRTPKAQRMNACLAYLQRVAVGAVTRLPNKSTTRSVAWRFDLEPMDVCKLLERVRREQR